MVTVLDTFGLYWGMCLLLQMKEWRDQIRRRREAKRYAKNPPGDEIPSSMGGPGMGLEDAQALAEEEAAREAQVPVMMPDMTLPLSFDGDNPVHRYRYLDTPSSVRVGTT